MLDMLENQFLNAKVPQGDSHLDQTCGVPWWIAAALKQGANYIEVVEMIFKAPAKCKFNV